MMNKLYLLLYMLTKRFIGLRRYQYFFEKLYQYGIHGMYNNAGAGVDKSGEEKVLEYISKKTSGKTIMVFDVGANTGTYAQLVIKYMGNSIIHCFEPSPSTFKILQKTLEGTSAKLHQIGISNIKDTKTLYQIGTEAGLASVYNRNLQHLGLQATHTETIDLTTLDNFCTENTIEKIDLLKMDIEGHEFSGLQGATRLLAERKIRFIQFEFGGCNIDSRTYFRDFWHLLHPNYSIYRIVKDGLFKIEKYDQSLEIFMLSNFLCELNYVSENS